MPEGTGAIYQIGQPIEFKYRCNGVAGTAEPITVEILDEAGAPDAQVVTLTQIGTTRLFKGVFIPDAVGVWAVHCVDSNGGDQVRDFSVGAVGVQSMAQLVVIIDGKIDGLDTKIDNLAADAGGAHFA